MWTNRKLILYVELSSFHMFRLLFVFLVDKQIMMKKEVDILYIMMKNEMYAVSFVILFNC